MKLASLNRWKASLAHLAISAAIGVAVVIGSLITLVIFDPKKKALKFDLSVIAALHLAALAYGCHVMVRIAPGDRRHGRNFSGISVVTAAS